MTPRPEPAQLALLKKRLLAKGAEINAQLSSLLAKQTPTVESIGPGSAPGEKPIERLRRFMAIVERQIGRVRDGSYGSCVACGDGLPFRELEQVPWIDTCQTCARKAAGQETPA